MPCVFDINGIKKISLNPLFSQSHDIFYNKQSVVFYLYRFSKLSVHHLHAGSVRFGHNTNR